jgi:serine/threonine-protein kinase
MQGLVVLHEDVQIVPLAEIPPQVRGQLGGQDGDFALTRPFSRNPSKVIDASAASLLRQFRSPRTIVDGILAYSKEAKVRAADVLEEAYPLIESCLRSSLLVEPGATAEKIQPSFAPGDSIDGNIIEHAVQALVDSEVYQVRTPSGQLAVLKIATPNVVPAMEKMLMKEAAFLRLINGAPAPAFLGMKTGENGRPWLLAEWFDGDDAQTKAQKIRETGVSGGLTAVCANILDAYATLHDRGVIHGDVHPRNLLVSESGEIRIIDFGISLMADGPAPQSPRAGVAFFFEPEYAQAILDGATAPVQTLHGEQFSVAALVYTLLCGSNYTDFSFDKETLLRQIVEDKPLPFERRCVSFPAALESVVRRGLEKNPAARFKSTRHFADAFRAALGPVAAINIPANDRESKILLDRVLQVIAAPDSPLTYEGPASPTASVTYGQAGIALAALRIASVRDDARLLALADAWAERAAVATMNPYYNCAVQITPETVGRITPWHTASGVAAVQAMIATARGDKLNLDSAVNRYLLQTSGDCASPDLTLGQASVLLGLTLLIEANGSARPPQLVERGNQIHAALRELMEGQPAIGLGGSIVYLGIAHGWSGLLYASMRWSRLTGTRPPAIVQARLQQLAALARYSGYRARWPVQTEPGSVTMPGWCNGSAGTVFLWTLAHSFFGNSLYLDLAEKSAMDAFEGSGGGHGLCCGFAGQAYAQLNIYNHTGRRTWLQQARILAERAAAFGNRVREGLPHSLYKGDMGVAVLIAELEKPETATMPFFESPR